MFAQFSTFKKRFLGKQMEALDYAKKHVQPFAPMFNRQIVALMSVIVSYPNVAERHQKLFMESNWLELEEEMTR